jgi:hypothetical protein
MWDSMYSMWFAKGFDFTVGRGIKYPIATHTKTPKSTPIPRVLRDSIIFIKCYEGYV